MRALPGGAALMNCEQAPTTWRIFTSLFVSGDFNPMLLVGPHFLKQGGYTLPLKQLVAQGQIAGLVGNRFSAGCRLSLMRMSKCPFIIPAHESLPQ